MLEWALGFVMGVVFDHLVRDYFDIEERNKKKGKKSFFS